MPTVHRSLILISFAHFAEGWSALSAQQH